MFRFWIETYDGRHVAWTHLTERAAKGMYLATTKRPPENVKRFGWEEMK